jgi:glucan-binding YG repeat protein
MVENDDVTKNGFVTDRGGVRYYENDVMIKGWKQIDSKLYYFDKETGYAPKNNSTLVVAPNGETEEKCLKFGENGLYEGLYTGFKSDRYYKDGVMQTGEQTIDGKEYYFDPETGIMVKSDVVEIEGTYYKYDENGVKQGKANGLVYADQTTRFFNDGTLIKGWLKYTVTENEGTAVETVEAITDITNVAANDNCYYTDSETGFMVKGETKEIGGKNYTFNENGLCTEISDVVSE